MKYKVLLVGMADALIDRFFADNSNEMECITAALIADDIAIQLRVFQPDVVIYCMHDELLKHISIVSENTGPKSETKTPLVVIGSAADYRLFLTATRKDAGLFLLSANSYDIIRQLLMNFLQSIDFGVDTRELYRAVSRRNAPKAENPPKPEAKKRILVIDDSPIMLRAIANLLKGEYEVATAPSGKVGLQYLEKRPADMILLDYEMPDEDGLVVLEKLKGNPRTANIPVVFLSGVSDQNKIYRAISMMPEGYLLKPVDEAALKEKIQEVLYN